MMSAVEVKYENSFDGSNSETDGEKSLSVKLEPISEKIKVVISDAKREFVLAGKIQACCGVRVSSFRNGLPN